MTAIYRSKFITRMLRLLILGLIIGVMMIGCATDGRVLEDVDALHKQHLIIAIGPEPEDGFDPTTGWGSYGSPLFQSTLLKRDQSLAIIGDLAEDVQVSEDGKVWTITIRSDVIFSDGVPLTADDVKFTFETAKQSASIVDLSNLMHVEAVDEHIIMFTLQQPQSTFRAQLTTIGIVPKHAYDDHYSQHPIGSGPFKFVQWDKGQQLIMETNREYYGKQPYFDQLTLLFLNEDAAFAAGRSGQVHIAYVPPLYSRMVPSGMRLEALQTVDNRGIMFPYIPSGGVTADGDPIGNDVTADVAIRKAVNVAIDRHTLVDQLFHGYATPAFSVNDHLPWWNVDTMFADADLEAAEHILSAGGWIVEAGGDIRVKEGVEARFPLIYPAGDVTRQSLALSVAEMMKPLGIDIIVEGKSWADIAKLMHSHAVLLGFGSYDPIEMYHLYSSKQQGIAFNNPGFYSNEKVDHWLEQAMQAKSEDEALAYWQLAQWDGEHGLAFHGDAPWAWLVNINHLYLIVEQLNIGEPSIQPHGHGWPLLSNVAEWYWNE